MEPYSIKYCIPYAIVFICYLYLSYRNSNNSRLQFICCAIFVIFFGFRGFVGWDWQNYYVMYSQLPNITELDKLFIFTGEEIVEPGFTLYMTIIKSVIDDWNFFILFSVVIDVLALHFFFKCYSVNYAFSFLIFFSVCVGLEFDLLRNMKAIILFLYAIRFIESGRLIPYILVMLVAITFHYSALIFIPLYFIGRHPFSRKVCAILLAISGGVYVLQLPLVSSLMPIVADFFGGAIGAKLDTYSDIGNTRGLTFGFLIRMLICLCVLWRYNECARYRFASFFLSLYFISVFSLWAFSDINVVSQRIETLLQPVQCVVYPMLLASFSRESNRFLMSRFICVYLFLVLARSSMIAMYQYENILFGTLSYEERLSRYSDVAAIIIEKNGQ